MMEFFEAVIKHGFLLNAVLVGILASIACGVVGTYVVSRRITYIAGSIAHCVLGGMGLARYLAVVEGWDAIQPLHGAIFAALLAAVVIGWVSLRAREREDTVIGAIWAIGMAIGIVFIARTPGYNEDLMSYLFGNILMVGRQDLLLIVGLDALVVLIAVLFYNKLQAICFDEEYARIRGINVELFYILLLCLTGLTVVILINVVGIVMVIALITLPAAIAGRLVQTLGRSMVVASLLSIVFTIIGLWISFTPDLPSGSTIILVAGAAYLLVTVVMRLIRPHG